MNSVLIPLLGAIVYLIGMRFYACYIDRKVIGADGRKATPAKMLADGVDFMSAPKSIPFGYQFKSIAGAAPVLGPVFTAIPMIFMYITTMAAISILSWHLLSQAFSGLGPDGKALAVDKVVGNWVAGLIGVALFIAALILAYNGWRAYVHYRSMQKNTPAAGPSCANISSVS